MRRGMKPRWSWAALALGAALLWLAAGCGEDASAPGEEPGPATVDELWLGAYTAAGGGGRGDLALALARTGDDFVGRLSVRSRATDDLDDWLFVSGASDGDSLRLYASWSPQPDDPYLLRASREDTSLAGTLRYAPIGLDATFACAPVPLDTVTVETWRRWDDSILGLAHDGTQLWAATLDSGYARFDDEARYQGSVRVLWLDEYEWVSDALAARGERLWGHLPSGVGAEPNRSHLIEFTPAGTITNDVMVMHRINGLAHDGTDLWSLDRRSRWLYRLDPLSGAALDSVGVPVPGLTDLSCYGQRFWAIAWFTEHLYEIDAQGRAVKAWPLPPGRVGGSPQAIACAGDDLWFARDDYGVGSLLYRLHVAP